LERDLEKTRPKAKQKDAETNSLRKQKQKRPNNSSVTVKPMDRTKKTKQKTLNGLMKKQKLFEFKII